MIRGDLEALTDEALVARLRVDDLAALGELYRRHGGMVESALARFSPASSKQEVEDMCQEVFLRLRAIAGRFREGATLKTWLYGIALQMARSRVRNAALRDRLLRRSGLENPGASLMADASPERAAAIRELIARALDRLPWEQREIVLLREVEGLSGAEIAAVLGIKPQAVWTRLHRARRRLLAAIHEGDGGSEDATAGVAYARKT